MVFCGRCAQRCGSDGGGCARDQTRSPGRLASDEFNANKHLIQGKVGSYGIYNTIRPSATARGGTRRPRLVEADSYNSKFYIGSAIDLAARLMHHLRYATTRNSNVRLQSAERDRARPTAFDYIF